MKPHQTRALLAVAVTLIVWCLIGWMLYSLRHSTEGEQLLASTRLLGFLCGGASVLLLITCIGIAMHMLRLARDTELEQRFPPTTASALGIRSSRDGEAAWMMAARLRGWAALTIAAGLLIAGAGIAIALRPQWSVTMPVQQTTSPVSAPWPGADPQSAHRLTPDQSTTVSS